MFLHATPIKFHLILIYFHSTVKTELIDAFFFFSSHLLTEWLLQTHLYDVELQELVCLELFCPHHQRSVAAGKKKRLI